MDISLLETRNGPGVKLLVNARLTEEDSSEPYSGFDGLERVNIEIRVGAITGSTDRAMTVTVEQSADDGDTWQPIASNEFTGDGVYRATADAPADLLRVSWEFTGGDVLTAVIRSVKIVPAYLNEAPNGGSQPIFVPLVFTELADATLYTASVDLPARSRVLDVLMETPTAWDALSVLQNLVDSDGNHLIGPNNDITAEQANQAGDALPSTGVGNPAGAGGWYSSRYTGTRYPTGTTITGTITTAGTSSPTGECRITLIVQVEAAVTNAVASGP